MADAARADRDDEALTVARGCADQLTDLYERVDPNVFRTWAAIVAICCREKLTWQAEWRRLSGESNASLWEQAAAAWDAITHPHEADYARWRQAEALLTLPSGRASAAAVLRTAADQATQHVPLVQRHPQSRPPRPHRAGRAGGASANTCRAACRAAAIRADRSGAASTASGRGRPQQRGDRRGTVHQQEDGQRARQQHPPQARRLHPYPGRRPRRTRWHLERAVTIELRNRVRGSLSRQGGHLRATTRRRSLAAEPRGSRWLHYYAALRARWSTPTSPSRRRSLSMTSCVPEPASVSLLDPAAPITADRLGPMPVEGFVESIAGRVDCGIWSALLRAAGRFRLLRACDGYSNRGQAGDLCDRDRPPRGAGGDRCGGRLG